MKKYVLGFPICLSEGEVLLIEKTKPVWQAGYLNGIGGKIEEADQDRRVYTGFCTPAQVAMAREAEEEVDLRTQPSDWLHFATMSSKYWVVYCFVADLLYRDYSLWCKMEEEKPVSVALKDLHVHNYKLLGNISWLVNMGLDALRNQGSFAPPIITYHDYSFPLAMTKEEKERRIKLERENEKK